MTEADFRRVFVRALRPHVALIEYMSAMSQGGIPDVYLLSAGRHFWIELKAVDHWPRSPDANVLAHPFTGPQLTFMRRVEAGGGRALGVVGFDGWSCVAIRPHRLGDGRLSRAEIERHRRLPVDSRFAGRFLETLARS